MWNRYFSKALQEAFDRSKARNEAVSLRGFASRIGVSPSLMSEIVREKRRITADRALEIAKKAGFDADVVAHLRQLMGEGPARPRKMLAGQAVELITNPLYYRLLCALEILPMPSTLKDVAGFLSIPDRDLKPVVDALESVDVVRVKGDRVYWTGDFLITPPDVPSTAIQNFHRTTLREAADGMAVPLDEREYTTITFAGKGERMADAKTQIRLFRDQLSESMRDPGPDRIYQLAIVLRPVSQTLKKKTGRKS